MARTTTPEADAALKDDSGWTEHVGRRQYTASKHAAYAAESDDRWSSPPMLVMMFDWESMLCAHDSSPRPRHKCANNYWHDPEHFHHWAGIGELGRTPQDSLMTWPANLQVKVIKLLSSPVKAGWLHDWRTAAMLDFPVPLKPCPIS